MHYFVAMTVTTRSRHHIMDEKGNTRHRINTNVTYIPAINRSDAERMSDGMNANLGGDISDGPLNKTRLFEVVGFTRDAKGRGVYLSISDMEMIACEYTQLPAKMAG